MEVSSRKIWRGPLSRKKADHRRCHLQESYFHPANDAYDRYSFLRPLYIYLSDKRDIYLELGIAQNDLRIKLGSDPMLAWHEDKTDQIPLVRICNGMMGLPYLNKKEVKDELEINKELFDTLSCDTSFSLLSGDAVNIGDSDIFKA